MKCVILFFFFLDVRYCVISLKRLCLLHEFSLLFCQRFVCVYVGFLFCFVHLFVYSFASTSLSWLMQLYCKSRRWTVLVQLCYSPLINCLGPSLCLFRFTLASECWYLQNTCWDFNWYCIESTDQVRKNQHPDNIESFCTWTQNLSPFI